ncbi:MAG: aminotransferase class V-fold PLP-dependent enzyme, partial [Legionella sp.]
MKSRIYNFGAGPAMLPEPILKEAQEELLNWHDKGMSVLEIGHRTTDFTDLLTHAEQSLRDLLTIPENYQILFFGGAARTHFSMIPMNLLNPEDQGAYLLTGIWSKMAYLEAKNLKNVYAMADSEADSFRHIPEINTWKVQDNTTYLYYCPNETVNGIRFPFIPQVNELPLIADMTSCLLTEPIDVSQYGLIFAGA